MSISIPTIEQRNAWFAVLRLEGKTLEQAKKGVTEKMMEHAGLDPWEWDLELGGWNFHGTPKTPKIIIKAVEGKGRGQFLEPSHYFVLLKATQDFNWQKIYAAAQKVLDLNATKARERTQKDQQRKHCLAMTESLKRKFGDSSPFETNERGNIVFRTIVGTDLAKAEALLEAYQTFEAAWAAKPDPK